MTLDALIDATSVQTSAWARDIDSYCAGSGLTLAGALDSIARAVARRYAAGTLRFTAADSVMNYVFAYGSTKAEIPAFMFSVFQAFDAGEFYPDAIRDPSPEERFTRPRITFILANDTTV